MEETFAFCFRSFEFHNILGDEVLAADSAVLTYHDGRIKKFLNKTKNIGWSNHRYRLSDCAAHEMTAPFLSIYVSARPIAKLGDQTPIYAFRWVSYGPVVLCLAGEDGVERGFNHAAEIREAGLWLGSNQESWKESFHSEPFPEPTQAELDEVNFDQLLKQIDG